MSDFRFEVWPTEYRRITQHFGANPNYYASFGLPGHDGVDLMAPSGSRIYCVASGVVLAVHRQANGHNYGVFVEVEHTEGYRTTYAHLEEVLVEESQSVRAGTVLGSADSTGNSFGPHLHLTLRKLGAGRPGWPGDLIDPTPFLMPLLALTSPVGPTIEGWILRDSLFMHNGLAQALVDGVQLWIGPHQSYLVPGGTVMLLAGRAYNAYELVRVPRVALGLATEEIPAAPDPIPYPTIASLDGWMAQHELLIMGERAVVLAQGAMLRQGHEADSPNIGLIKGGSTVTLLGLTSGDQLLVRVRRDNFLGAVALPVLPPLPSSPLDPWPDNAYLGWVEASSLAVAGPYALVRPRYGVTLYAAPTPDAPSLGLLKGYATVSLAGLEKNGYIPVLLKADDILSPVKPWPLVESPEPLSEAPAPLPFSPPADSVPGWLLTGDLAGQATQATATLATSILHKAPQRDAAVLGFVLPHTPVLVIGAAQGEFTPVRVETPNIQAPVGEGLPAPEVPLVLGQARLGLHTSADPVIAEAEIQEFRDARPGLIKILSFQQPDAVRRLLADHPRVTWIIRALLDMGGRAVTPEQFVEWTLSDVQRAVEVLVGQEVLIELHNEPNTTQGGLGSAWADGQAFSQWFLAVLERYRAALPSAHYIYPGLSPGGSVRGVRQDHVEFVEASRAAVKAADCLGIHLYWSNIYPVQRALELLDDYTTRFRGYPIFITEAANNDPQARPMQQAREYISFWQQLQWRPAVRGVAYFVASASNPKVASMVWAGRGIGQIVGRR